MDLGNFRKTLFENKAVTAGNGPAWPEKLKLQISGRGDT